MRWLNAAIGGLVLITRAALTAPAFAQSAGFEPNIGHFFFALAVMMGLILMIPTFIAFYRQHPNRWLIAVINIVFGPTLLGWLICLIWALDAAHRSPTGSHGGESGLNLFANDVQTVRLVQSPEAVGPAQPDPEVRQPRTDTEETDELDQLKRLKRLFEQGLLDPDEYAHLKGPLIDRIMAR